MSNKQKEPLKVEIVKPAKTQTKVRNEIKANVKIEEEKIKSRRIFMLTCLIGIFCVAAVVLSSLTDTPLLEITNSYLFIIVVVAAIFIVIKNKK